MAKITVSKKATGKGSGITKPMTVSSSLEAVVGEGPLSRGAVMKAIWVYIKKKGLQGKENKRTINPDKALAKVFGSDKTIDMFKMAGLLSKHLS